MDSPKVVVKATHDIPKKELGQHWLEDSQALHAIVDHAAIQQGDIVLEIGPGTGFLTGKLLEAGAKVYALEYDAALAQSLPGRLGYSPDVTVIQGDIRTHDLTTLPKSYKIVANIPYYLTSNLLRLLTETTNPPQLAVLLMQKEVAERIAHTGDKKSLLTMIAQLDYECNLGIEVPAHLFVPPPKVDSQVLIMSRRLEPKITVDRQRFIRLLKAGFSEKRKNLRNALSGGLARDKIEIDALLKGSGLDPRRRAESLGWDDWQRLYDVLND